MFDTLPTTPEEFTDWPWETYQAYYEELAARELTPENVEQWMADWTAVTERAYESYSRLSLAKSQDTTDAEIETRFNKFLETIFPPFMQADQMLKVKLLQSELVPAGAELPMRKMQAEAELFREENIPLLTEEQKLGNEYDKIVGAQTVEWNGEEKTPAQMQPYQLEKDRTVREKAMRLVRERQLADREALNDLWQKLMNLRGQIAANAGFSNYRDYMWQGMKRFDYTPEDCRTFHEAIEQVVVPAAVRIYEKRRQRLGLDTLRPWDLQVPVTDAPPLKPYDKPEELEVVSDQIFHKVDPELGARFRIMRDESLLDLPNRKGKAPGAYCTAFPVQNRPFIFMNAVGLHDDVQTLLHETGHAFHVFETEALPYLQQQDVGMEFAEVASMAMELLAAPYLAREEGGFYTTKDAARARIEHLENIVLFWPYMAVVDAFQHWVYENHEAATDPANCDRKWSELWERFMKGVDWRGLDPVKETGWHRKLHIFQVPFYYVEYGLAQLGAVQIWRNALDDQAEAVAAYRRGLALGGTVSLSELYATAGAKFAFDAETLGEAIDLIERTLESLEQA